MALVHAPAYVRAEHPELGPVVYTPGELLPPWVRDALENGAELVATGEQGVMRLTEPRRQGGKS